MLSDGRANGTDPTQVLCNNGVWDIPGDLIVNSDKLIINNDTLNIGGALSFSSVSEGFWLRCFFYALECLRRGDEGFLVWTQKWSWWLWVLFRGFFQRECHQCWTQEFGFSCFAVFFALKCQTKLNFLVSRCAEWPNTKVGGGPLWLSSGVLHWVPLVLHKGFLWDTQCSVQCQCVLVVSEVAYWHDFVFRVRHCIVVSLLCTKPLGFDLEHFGLDVWTKSYSTLITLRCNKLRSPQLSQLLILSLRLVTHLRLSPPHYTSSSSPTKRSELLDSWISVPPSTGEVRFSKPKFYTLRVSVHLNMYSPASHPANLPPYSNSASLFFRPNKDSVASKSTELLCLSPEEPAPLCHLFWVEARKDVNPVCRRLKILDLPESDKDRQWVLALLIIAGIWALALLLFALVTCKFSSSLKAKFWESDYARA